MKRVVIIAVMLISMILYGCQNTEQEEQEGGTTISDGQNERTSAAASNDDQEESASEAAVPATTEAFTDIVQGGPYGEISLSLPDGWKFETCRIDSGDLQNGLYGIRFYPEDVAEGYVELVYTDSFGVCGTGLETEETIIAGMPASIGTYDNHEYWDFITFQEDCEGIVALTYSAAGWWGEYSDRILDILDTLSFDRNVKEGGACVYSAESELNEVGLQFSLKNISGTGATLVFHLYDAGAPDGELICGDDFLIEIQKDGSWEAAPIKLEGDYGFNDIAYMITDKGAVEIELNWEWLYGELAPGEYRIGKSILDSRGSGDFDKYMVYAGFVLN